MKRPSALRVLLALNIAAALSTLAIQYIPFSSPRELKVIHIPPPADLLFPNADFTKADSLKSWQATKGIKLSLSPEGPSLNVEIQSSGEVKSQITPVDGPVILTGRIQRKGNLLGNLFFSVKEPWKPLRTIKVGAIESISKTKGWSAFRLKATLPNTDYYGFFGVDARGKGNLRLSDLYLARADER